jgi:dolichyl-phosphate beta-glucosyltransferase
MRISAVGWIFSAGKKKRNMLELSIIIPAYNEAERILPTLRSFHNYFVKQNITFEIVVVDDGSTDNTVTCVEDLKKEIQNLRVIMSPGNFGKGHAIRTGMLEATGRFRLFSDADGSTPVEEVERLLLPLREERADLVIGSRYLPGSVISQKQPKFRRIWSRLSNLVVQQILLPGIVDPHCGFKAFRADAAVKLFSNATINGWSFDLEILALAKKFNLQMLEVPVKWANDGRSKGRLSHLPKEIASVMEIKKRIAKIK